MTIALIQTALEEKLATIASPLPTAYENVVYAPVTGQPYQRVYMLVNTPVDHAVTADLVEQRGIFQISLFYPPNVGRMAAQARAQAIADLFAPVQFLFSGPFRVELQNTAQIGSGSVDEERWAVPVKVRWQSFIV